MERSAQQELAVSLTEILRKIMSGGSVDKSEIEELASRVSSLEDPYLRKHLLTILWEIGKGSYGENDILGKLTSYDGSDLSKILDSLQEFSYEEPFDELEFKEVFKFWMLVLRSLSNERRF
ncbi:MAG: hypothetical protein NZ992_08555 [Candidatus Korarchaeum sp.]|nr:hypothetical protein [Candidatus Korarchaeum sp.]MDW8035735.1 hypothetical protein [Candidatus Korarchaeum sp.]